MKGLPILIIKILWNAGDMIRPGNFFVGHVAEIFQDVIVECQNFFKSSEESVEIIFVQFILF